MSEYASTHYWLQHWIPESVGSMRGGFDAGQSISSPALDRIPRRAVYHRYRSRSRPMIHDRLICDIGRERPSPDQAERIDAYEGNS